MNMSEASVSIFKYSLNVELPDSERFSFVILKVQGKCTVSQSLTAVLPRAIQIPITVRVRGFQRAAYQGTGNPESSRPLPGIRSSCFCMFVVPSDARIQGQRWRAPGRRKMLILKRLAIPRLSGAKQWQIHKRQRCAQIGKCGSIVSTGYLKRGGLIRPSLLCLRPNHESSRTDEML